MNRFLVSNGNYLYLAGADRGRRIYSISKFKKFNNCITSRRLACVIRASISFWSIHASWKYISLKIRIFIIRSILRSFILLINTKFISRQYYYFKNYVEQRFIFYMKSNWIGNDLCFICIIFWSYFPRTDSFLIKKIISHRISNLYLLSTTLIMPLHEESYFLDNFLYCMLFWTFK